MMTQHLKITFSSLTDEIPNNNGDKLNNNGTFDEVGSGSILDTADTPVIFCLCDFWCVVKLRVDGKVREPAAPDSNAWAQQGSWNEVKT